MKPTETSPQRPSFWPRHLRHDPSRLAAPIPACFLVYLLTSLGFTALLVADLHLVRLLLDRLPLFTAGELSYQAVLLTILLLGGVNILLHVDERWHEPIF